MDSAENGIRKAGDLLRGGDPAGAEALCRKVLAGDPHHAGALGLIGRIRSGLGDHAGALEPLSESWALAPDDPEVGYRLGVALTVAFRYEAAIKVLEEALRLDPGRANTHRALAHAHLGLGDNTAGARHFEAAYEADPTEPTDIYNFLFTAHYDPDRSPEDLRALHAEWGAKRLARIAAPPPPPFTNAPDPDRPIKVGYLSPDFWGHPVGSFIASIIAFHDPRAVESHCYASVASPDAVTDAFRRTCRQWRDVRGMPDAEVADLIRADGIDILVDLAGYTNRTRIDVLAYRPAPIQASYLGYPGTTGLDVVDYRITDAVANPPGTERFYTERLARVEGGFCCYLPPPAPEPGPLPALSNGYVTFASLVTVRKLNPPTIALWARLLNAVPTARLLLFRNTLADAATRERFLTAFEGHGVGRDRIEIRWEAPPEAKGGFLAVYQGVDVVLDTLPFNGHTSTCEALLMGVPVVTLAGPDFAGRLSASVLAMAGLGGLVAATEDEFVALAAGMAGDLEGLAGLRKGMRAHLRRTRLVDSKSCTRAVEATYREMWREWCAGRGAAG